jgi:uroporphyrinogen III methyltransferase/synthase
MRVVMTGSTGTLAGLETALAAAGMTLFAYPLIRFAPPPDWTPLDTALARIHSYAGLALTSPRAALAVADRLACRAPPGPSDPLPVPVWTSGHATAAPIADRFRIVIRVQSATAGAAAAVARAMLEAGVGSPILFPCGDIRRDTLIQLLEAAGRRVEPVLAYKTLLATPDAARAAARSGDVLLVASPSVARLLAQACPPAERPPVVAIGPSTRAACEAASWPPVATAESPSVEAVVLALRRARDETE